MPPGGEAADDQAGIGRRCEPDRNVESFVNQINGPLAYAQNHFDLGIRTEIFRDHRRDKLNDMRSRIDAQRAARRRL